MRRAPEGKTVLADEPVVAIDHGGEDIGQRFVKGPGLEAVLQVDGAFDDAVGHFVGCHIQGFGQRIENGIAIAIGNDGTVPKGIAHGLAFVGDVDHGNHAAAAIVEAAAVVDFGKVVKNFACIAMGRDGDWILPAVVGGAGVKEMRIPLQVFSASIQGNERTLGIAQQIGLDAGENRSRGIEH